MCTVFQVFNFKYEVLIMISLIELGFWSNLNCIVYNYLECFIFTVISLLCLCSFLPPPSCSASFSLLLPHLSVLSLSNHWLPSLSPPPPLPLFPVMFSSPCLCCSVHSSHHGSSEGCAARSDGSHTECTYVC